VLSCSDGTHTIFSLQRTTHGEPAHRIQMHERYTLNTHPNTTFRSPLGLHLSSPWKRRTHATQQPHTHTSYTQAHEELKHTLAHAQTTDNHALYAKDRLPRQVFHALTEHLSPHSTPKLTDQCAHKLAIRHRELIQTPSTERTNTAVLLTPMRGAYNAQRTSTHIHSTVYQQRLCTRPASTIQDRGNSLTQLTLLTLKQSY
jgi:hypothetical protein